MPHVRSVVCWLGAALVMVCVYVLWCLTVNTCTLYVAEVRGVMIMIVTREALALRLSAPRPTLLSGNPLSQAPPFVLSHGAWGVGLCCPRAVLFINTSYSCSGSGMCISTVGESHNTYTS
jgi:hypothetical protein